MRTVALLLLAWSSMLPAGALSQTRNPSSESLKWLSGCWARESGRLTTEESWTEPRGGILLGLARTTRGDSLVDFEFSRIAETDSGLVFFANPSGQAPASFRAARLDSHRVIFENLNHDFPQRVIYQRITRDSLSARVEGTVDGILRKVDFLYRRVPCPGE
ncbi:hypothetical protein EHM92_02480 [bacterium]|nr:MAG: hypothetical protein EHM92_02480 [bacterium]